MSKLFAFNDKALRAISKGINTLTKAVAITLGPKGKNVLIKKDFDIISTKDGVSVAKEIFLKDKFENMGAQIAKQAALQTADISGDGTTTSLVLTKAIFTEGLKNVIARANPIFLKKGIEIATKTCLEHLDTITTEIKSDKEIKQIATISANNDEEIGSIIADAMKKVGRDGIITISDAKGIDTTLEVVEGMQFKNGYVSAYFVTDAEKMVASLDNPLIFITDKKLTSAKDVVAILEKVMEKDTRPLLIIADDIESEALNTLVINKIKANLPIAAVRAPAFGDNRKEILEDIAALTNAKVVSESVDLNLENFDETVFGSAKKITVSKEDTTIIDGQGDINIINQRANHIKTQIDLATSDYDIEKLHERLAHLVGGVAIIHVGAATETEMKEKKQRVDDALNATKAATIAGIVAGGGVALLRCIEKLDQIEAANSDEKLGIQIVKNAIAMPAATIANNASMKGDVIVEKILEKKGSWGYNCLTDKFSDLIKDGVIDPVLVTKTALKNAASIAILLLSVAAMITDKPSSKKESQMPMDPSMMGGMGGMPSMGGMGGMMGGMGGMGGGFPPMGM